MLRTNKKIIIGGHDMMLMEVEEAPVYLQRKKKS